MGLTAFFSFSSFLWTLMHISFSKTCVPLLLIGLLLVLFTRPHSLHLRGSSFLPWHSLFSSGSSPMNVHRLILVQSQKAGETLAYSHVTQSVPVPIQSTNLFSIISLPHFPNSIFIIWQLHDIKHSSLFKPSAQQAMGAFKICGWFPMSCLLRWKF